MEIIVLQSEVYKEFMRQIDEIKVAIQKLSRDDQHEWLDIDSTCRMLHISKRTCQKYRDDGILPYSQRGHKIYFKKADLLKHLEDHYNK